MNAHSIIVTAPAGASVEGDSPRALVWYGSSQFNVHLCQHGTVGFTAVNTFTWRPDGLRAPTLAEAAQHMDDVLGDPEHPAWDPWR